MYYDQLNHPALNYATIICNNATFILLHKFLIMVFIKGKLKTTFNIQKRTQFKIPKTYDEHILQCNEKIHLVPIWILRTPYIHSVMESQLNYPSFFQTWKTHQTNRIQENIDYP